MPTSLVADGALAVALAVHAELLARLRRVDAPTPPWWFGYARDGTNLSAVLIAWGAYSGRLPPAVAFLAAALTMLATYVLDWVVARGFKLAHARLALGAASSPPGSSSWRCAPTRSAAASSGSSPPSSRAAR